MRDEVIFFEVLLGLFDFFRPSMLFALRQPSFASFCDHFC